MRRSGILATPVLLSLLLLALSSAVGSLQAQDRGPMEFWLQARDGERESLQVAAHRGYAATPLRALATLGWEVRESPRGARARLAGTGPEVELRVGSPFVAWDGELAQLADVPYRFGRTIWIPVQLVTDLLSARAASWYTYDAGSRVLRVRDPALWKGGMLESPSAEVEPGPERGPSGVPGAREEPREASAEARANVSSGKAVVIIDPGHGGSDPGAMGPAGIKEKDVALGVGLALARELRKDPGLEVHLTRDRDVLVPLWERGERATSWKGDRPGVFVSLHANALPRTSTSRGFETYFLSEARTEHERRVAAIENAPLFRGDEGGDGAAAVASDPDLSFILKELRNFDHQHWSAHLADLVQQELDGVHPGPNRGVKQGPFAVITNTLMPSVLVELGFLSHREEERLLARSDFHEDAAEALARAVRRFLEGYPPGTSAPVEIDR